MPNGPNTQVAIKTLIDGLFPLLVIGFAISFLSAILKPARRRGRRRRRESLSDELGSMLAGLFRPREASLTFAPSENAADEEPESIPQTNWTLANIRKLEWKRFEILTADFFRALGFTAQLTRVGADGGVDVVLRKPGDDNRVALAQCKAWQSYAVGVKPVRELAGVMAAEKVSKGVFLTTSEYSREAIDFAELAGIELVDGNALVSFIRQLPIERQKELLKSTFSGNYTTPTCPKCDIKMVLRTARKGLTPGSQFWGCPNYPACRQTFKVKEG